MSRPLDKVTRIGGHCFEAALGVFLVTMLVAALNTSSAKTELLAGAGRAKARKTSAAATSGVNALLPLQGTTCAQVICIKDDSNGNQLTFCRTTGEYTFTNCTTFTLTGIGLVRIQGSIVTLEHFASDRRITATVDGAAKRGNASAQHIAAPKFFKSIIDRNTANSSCGCQAAVVVGPD